MFSQYYLATYLEAESVASTSYYDDTIADGDLLAYWRFGDAGGTAVDEHGATYDFAYGTGVTVGQTGLINSTDDAIDNDGTDDVGDVASGLNPWSGAFTIECWATNQNGTTGYAGLASTGAYQTSGFRFGRRDGTNGFAFWTDENIVPAGGDDPGFVLTSGSAPTDDQTYHIVLTYDGTDAWALYVDGSLVDSTTSTLYTEPGGGLQIGGNNGGQFWDGHIDEFAVYGAEKDATWVADHYDLGVSGVPAAPDTYAVDTLSNVDLEAYWRLGDTGSTVTDSSGNGYNLTRGAGWTTGVTALVDDTDTAMSGDGTTSIGLAASGLNPWSSAFTVECWVREGVGTTISRGVASAESYGVNGFRLGRQASRWAFWTAESGGDVTVRSADAAVVVGTAVHLVATRSGTTYKLYVNGVDVTTAGGDSTGTSYTAPSGGMSVGGFGGGNWQGTMDEVAVYSSSKSAGWVAARYTLGAP